MTPALAATQAADSRWPTALGALLVAVAALLAAFWSAWFSMAHIWWNTTTFHHGFLIAPIALFLAWRQRDALAAVEPRQEQGALLPMAACAVLWLVGRAGDVQLLQHVAVVGMLVTIAVALLGRDVARVLWFPLLFLFFMVPFGEGLVPWLQAFTARFAVALLRLVGVPVYHDGVLIETPSGLFEVAEACAGIRFLIANLVVVVLFAHLALRRAWKWLLFLALGAVVPVIANGVRAFGIVYTAYLTDNAYAAGVDHLVYGWGFFTAVMLLLLLIGRLIADEPAPALEPKQVPHHGLGQGWRLAFLPLVLAVLAAGPAYAALVMVPPAPGRLPQLAPPTGHGVWRAGAAAVDHWQPVVRGADLEQLQRYVHDGDGRNVDLFLGFYAAQRQGAEVVHQDHRMADGERWLRTAGGSMPLHAAGLPGAAAFERQTSRPDGRQQLVFWWYWVDGTFTDDPLRAKFIQITDRLLGRSAPAAIMAVAVPLDPDAPAAARATVESFLGPEGPGVAGHLEALAKAGG
jgi:exosortase A